MAKQTITITVDSDVIDEIRQLKINISGEINEYLRSLLARYNEDVEGISIRLERLALEKAMKKMSHWQNIMKSTQTRINRWDDIQKGKEEDRLNQEKEDIESKKKCINCGRILEAENKSHDFKKGIICNSCFLSASGSQYRKWNENGEEGN